MKKHIVPIAAVICAVAVVCMVCVLILSKPENNDFQPPAFDAAAQSGKPSVPDSLGYSELDAKAFLVSVCGKLTARGNTVDVYLTNPEGNTVWIKLRLYDDSGRTLGETGLIKAGEYVKPVTLDTVPQQSCAVKVKIMAYEPETYYSAGAVNLNTTLTIE